MVKDAIIEMSTYNHLGGPDKIRMKETKYCLLDIILTLTALFRKYLSERAFPEIWKPTEVVPQINRRKDRGRSPM